MRQIRARIVLLSLLTFVVLAGLLGAPDVSASHFRRDRIRIFGGPNPAAGPLLYTIERIPFLDEPAWWVFAGTPNYAPPAYAFTEDHLYQGSSVFYGPILATFRNDVAYLGAYVFSPPVLRLAGNRLFEGPSLRGTILFTFHGERMFAGPNHAGEIVANATRDIDDLEGPLELVLGLLFTGQIQETPPPPTPIPPPPPTPPPPP